jgi:acetyl esterase
MSLQRTTFRATAFAVRMAAAFGFGGAQAGDSGQPGKAADAGAKAGSMARADADMAAVLDALAGLKPKAIETSSVGQARKQPTSADAVNVVLRAKGSPTSRPSACPASRAKTWWWTVLSASCPRACSRPRAVARSRWSSTSMAAAG